MKGIIVKDLSFCLDDKKILDNINFSIEYDRVVGICGEIGSGKTTLAKLISGYLESKGSIKNNEDCIVISENSSTALITNNIYSECILMLKDKDIDKDNIIDEKLRYFDAIQYKNKDFSKLSGGEKQKLAVISYFIRPHKTFILDDCLSSISDHKEFLDKIISLIKSYDSQLIIISHNYDDFKNCDRIIKLKEGKVVYNGSEISFINNEIHTDYGNQYDFSKNIIGEEQTLINIDNLSLKLNDKDLFNKFNLKINLGDIICITGKNGSGKSTLAKLIVGYEKNKNIIYNYKNSYALKCGYYPQNAENYLTMENGEEETNFSKKILKNQLKSEKIDDLFENFDFLTKKTDIMSLGQRKILLLKSILLTNFSIYVFDELEDNLSFSALNKILKILLDLKKDYRLTYVFISNDKKIISIANKVIKIGD
jgi:energy-coupling factor transport system ATP-binding protein